VHEAEKLSLEQIESFLNASQEILFEGETQKQIYHWIEQVLGRQKYHQQSRQARGLLRSSEDDEPEPGAGDTVDR